jgi:hypothetical protein
VVEQACRAEAVSDVVNETINSTMKIAGIFSRRLDSWRKLAEEQFQSNSDFIDSLWKDSKCLICGFVPLHRASRYPVRDIT